MEKKEVEKKTGIKKFDICLMNPPYSRKLHLKFLEKVIEISNKVITIQPINWLTSPDDRKKEKSSYYTYENSISKHIADIELFSEEQQKKYFGIQSTQIGIYVCDEQGGYDYKKMINHVVEKVMDYIQDNMVKSDYNEYKGWRVYIPKSQALSGGGDRPPGLRGLSNLRYFYDGKKDGKPWYEHYAKNQYSKTTKEITRSIKFNSEEEARNFCKSFETNFCTYIEHNLRTDMALTDNRLLWMGNAKHPRTGTIGYKDEWTNDDFYTYFKISDEDKNKIEKFVNDNKIAVKNWWKNRKNK